MKYLKLYEAWKPLIEIKTKDGTVLRYQDEWKTCRSKEREMITDYLEDIFQELKDDRYRINTGGFMAGDFAPYVWISSRRRREGFDADVVTDYIERAKDYLESIGFVTDLEKMSVGKSNEQWYFYFDKSKPDVKITESNHIDDIKDRFLEVEDNGFEVGVRGDCKDKRINFGEQEFIHEEYMGEYLYGEVVPMIEVSISPADINRKFHLSEIKDTIDETIDNIKEYDYIVDSILINSDGEHDAHYAESIESVANLENSDESLNGIEIYFIKE